MTKAAAIRFCEKQNYDLIVLDINLPDGNGFDFCQYVKERRPDTAVIYLTANDMESDMLKGFELGADDYVTKPFPIYVFQKKVSALINRIQKQTGGDCYSDGNLYINFSETTAILSGEPVTLTAMEYRLLRVFVKNPNIVLFCAICFVALVRQEHGVNVYGLDDFPAGYVQVLDGQPDTEKWNAGTGVYVTPMRMMGAENGGRAVAYC